MEGRGRGGEEGHMTEKRRGYHTEVTTQFYNQCIYCTVLHFVVPKQ